MKIFNMFLILILVDLQLHASSKKEGTDDIVPFRSYPDLELAPSSHLATGETAGAQRLEPLPKLADVMPSRQRIRDFIRNQRELGLMSSPASSSETSTSAHVPVSSHRIIKALRQSPLPVGNQEDMGIREMFDRQEQEIKSIYAMLERDQMNIRRILDRQEQEIKNIYAMLEIIQQEKAKMGRRFDNKITALQKQMEEFNETVISHLRNTQTILDELKNISDRVSALEEGPFSQLPGTARPSSRQP